MMAGRNRSGQASRATDEEQATDTESPLPRLTVRETGAILFLGRVADPS